MTCYNNPGGRVDHLDIDEVYVGIAVLGKMPDPVVSDAICIVVQLHDA